MRNLILFLQRYHFVLLFLLLESLAILLLINSHTYHRAAVVNTTNALSGRLLNTSSQITGYFVLQSENRILGEQNAMLQQQLFYLKQKVDTLVQNDTIDYPYDFIPARVISNTVNRRNNHIIINKGRAHGIEKEMGLITAQGVAGLVTGVSDSYATAMSILHTQTQLSVKFSKNQQMASLVWHGPDFKTGIVEHIPTHIDVRPGDTVVTSGHSFIFPEGIMVGTVLEYFQPEGSGLYHASLLFSTDFNRLNHVYAVKNNQLIELQLLEQSREDE